jgi:hypothetical protein
MSQDPICTIPVYRGIFEARKSTAHLQFVDNVKRWFWRSLRVMLISQQFSPVKPHTRNSTLQINVPSMYRLDFKSPPGVVEKQAHLCKNVNPRRSLPITQYIRTWHLYHAWPFTSRCSTADWRGWLKRWPLRPSEGSMSDKKDKASTK